MGSGVGWGAYIRNVNWITYLMGVYWGWGLYARERTNGISYIFIIIIQVSKF